MKKLLLLIPLLVAVGCQHFTTDIFRMQQTSENIAYTAYVGYTQGLSSQVIVLKNPGVSNQIKEARLKFAATDRTIDALRVSYATNSALKPQIEATIATLQDNASNLVWLINYFKQQ